MTSFIDACKNGDLEIVQSMYSLNNNIDISAENELAFRLACANGHLEVTKWLLYTKPTINISAESEFAFIYSCRSGHLELAKWLYEMKPTINISAKNEEAFINSCINNHIKVAQWFCSLFPDNYKLTIIGNKIYCYYVNKNIKITNHVTIDYVNKEEIICPICYDEDKLIEIQTSCNHNFCKYCITQYYTNRKNGINNIKCPYCRQEISHFNSIELIKQ